MNATDNILLERYRWAACLLIQLIECVLLYWLLVWKNKRYWHVKSYKLQIEMVHHGLFIIIMHSA